MANRKPIRWAVPLGGESYMGLAQYFLTHEENMRQAFSQPSRRARRTLPDGTIIDYIMNDVVDFISISPPQKIVRAMGKAMTWDKLPPLEEGTNYIDLSQMTEDPDVEGGYYCTVSVFNGTDENNRTLPAEFSVKMSTGSVGWSIEQGIRQTDGSYKVDGKSATLLLGADVEGDCEIVAWDGKTTLKERVKIFKLDETPVVFTQDNYSIYKDGSLWKEGYFYYYGENNFEFNRYHLVSYPSQWPGYCGTTSQYAVTYIWEYILATGDPDNPVAAYEYISYYNYNGLDVWSPPNYQEEIANTTNLILNNGVISGTIPTWDSVITRYYNVLNASVTEEEV